MTERLNCTEINSCVYAGMFTLELFIIAIKIRSQNKKLYIYQHA